VGIYFTQIYNGITLGAVYALVALGYTMVYGIIELINFAHGDVFMFGTVITLIIVQILGLTAPVSNVFLLLLLIIALIVISTVIAAALNVSIEFLAYRPLRKAPRLAPLIAAIGVSFIIENTVQLWRGAGFTAFPDIFPSTALDHLDFGFFTIPATFDSGFGPTIRIVDIFIIVAAIGLMIGIDRVIRTTRLGRGMRATAQDPEAAALMGVNINRTISLTFLIGGGLAGAAGVLYELNVGQVWFFTGFQLGLIAFTAAVLGGIGNIRGAVLGGFVIGLIQALAIQSITSIGENGAAWSDAIVFAILVLILVFRPSGLLGQQVPDKV
jgi:branched-chain amino acid transport system permease protein